MKFFAAIAAFVSVLPYIAAVSIDTPNNVVQCQPTLLTYGGTPPFYLTIIPGGQPSAPPLELLGKQDGDSATWLVDLPTGTPITFELKDFTGAIAYTDIVNILDSDDTTCLRPGAYALPPPSSNTGGNTSVGGSTKTPQVSAPTTSAGSRPAPGNVPPQQSPPVVTTSTRPVGGIQAVSSSISSSLAAPTVVSGGVKSLVSISTFGLAAVVTLFGALIF